MDGSCDRCGPAVPALWRVARDAAELFFCGSCAYRLHRALRERGWEFWPLGYRAAPQAGAG